MKRAKNIMFFQRTALWGLALAATLLLSASLKCQAAEVLPAYPAEPSADCVLVGVPGQYVTDTQAVIDRINEIRYEACTEGVKSPATGNPLTVSDYVPIKWSSGVEAAVRYRASEAGIAKSHSDINTGHSRLNGGNIWQMPYPSSFSVRAEIIAYNWGKDLLSSISQWYGEKSAWVNSTGGVTGHYEALINPTNTYIGLACFYSDSVYWRSTTLAQLGSGSGLDETPMAAVDNCVQAVEVKNSYISAISIEGGEVHMGETGQMTLRAEIPGMNKEIDILEGAQWTSSDPTVAEVDSEGVVTPKKIGSVTITAKVGDSLSAECTVAVGHEHDYVEAVTRTATCIAKGEKTFTCSICSDCYTEELACIPHSYSDEWTVDRNPGCDAEGSKSRHCKTVGCDAKTDVTAIEKKDHVWDTGTVTLEATVSATGIMTYRCQNCEAAKTETIPKKTEGEPGGSTGGETGTQPGGSTGGETGTQPGGSTGGETGTQPGGSTGGETGTQPGGNTGTGTMELPHKGQVLLDPKSGATYKVTAVNGTEAVVEYAKAGKNVSGRVELPAQVSIEGVVYKVTSIGKDALKNNKKITEVVIGSNVTAIGENAFKGCTKLKKVVIPSKVNKIGKNAFRGCKRLKSIIIKTTKLTKKNVGSGAFKGIAPKAVIKVPAKKLKAYKSMLRAKGAGARVKIKK